MQTAGRLHKVPPLNPLRQIEAPPQPRPPTPRISGTSISGVWGDRQHLRPVSTSQKCSSKSSGPSLETWISMLTAPWASPCLAEPASWWEMCPLPSACLLPALPRGPRKLRRGFLYRVCCKDRA